MGVLTTFLKLLKPSENDYYNQQTEQADNWDKVDNYAVLTNTDKNAVWGGEYGGKIQDPIPKELNKRYIDNINGKAFICIKAGDSTVTSNTTEYFTPCNVVDNLGKLQNLEPYAKIKNLGSITSGKITDLVKLENIGFLCIAYTSGYIPIDAPIGASVTASIIINLVSPRYVIEWNDTNKTSKKLNYNNSWGQWY